MWEAHEIKLTKTVICRSLMLLQLHNSSQQVVQVSPGRNRWTMRTIKHSILCEKLSCNVPGFPALPWTVVILLTKDSTVTISEDALLLNGSSETRLVVFLDLQLSPGEKNTQCHSPQKKKSWSNFVALPLLSLWGERSKTTRRKQLMQSTRFVFSPSLMPTSFDCTLQQMWRSNQIDFLDS